MKSPLPILYLDNTFTFGGAINSLLYLLKALDKTIYEPILVTGQPESFLENNFQFIKWYQVKIRVPWIHNNIFKKITSLPLCKTNTFIYKLVKRLRFIFWIIFITTPEAIRFYYLGKKHKVQLVHLNNIFGSQLSGIIAAKLLNVPCVAHLRKFERINVSTRCYIRHIDHHIAISNAVQKNILQFGVPKGKTTTIFDAIDLDAFSYDIACDYLDSELNLDANDALFGIFGRIVEWKGITDFVRVAAIVCKENPNAKGFIVGDYSDGNPAYWDEIKKLIRTYGLESRVILTGYRKDIPSLMKRMDVVVHLSITPEPFGMVLIEAMAMKKPVIATRIGGPLDIVEEEMTGFLVDPGDYKAAATYVNRLFANSSLAHSLGEKGRARVETFFSKERYAAEVEDVYRHLLNVEK
jgi:glycosyltransferase involved in cell wall biosynthesis